MGFDTDSSKNSERGFEKELEKAKELALEAGKEILNIYNSGSSEDFEKEYKEDDSPLTAADKKADEVIFNGIKENFPDYGILTEETEDTNERLSKDLVWIVDPLDGTKEFIKKNGEFTVNIALLKEGEPVIGVIYVPAKNVLYYASEQGAWKEEFSGEGSKDTREKLEVSEISELEEMKLVKSRSHASEQLQEIIDKAGFKDTIPSGSSVKGCLIAEGQAEVYFRLGRVMEWDIAAMHCIVTKSGGKLTDLNDNEINYNKENPVILGFLASNSRKHEELLGLVE